ncbi:MAG: MGH1-like glycoside hydrolase domain-containing protein [Calditrichia bacterium]
MNIEQKRLLEEKQKKAAWKKWGPYLTERQWGTVREDYSPHGTAWEYVSHEMSRSKAYRWGEEGIGGICDRDQLLCLGLALWNGKDPFLKENFFGLTGNEGNHAEDLKEHYYFLDSTPTHSYMKMLYKYPQAEFPYQQLRDENRKRTKTDREFELLDTGIFDDDRYFDVFIEYAKAGPEDILLRYTIHNRGPEAAEMHLLPQLWFRNTWSWKEDSPRPALKRNGNGISVKHPDLPSMSLYCDSSNDILFCENESNYRKLYGSSNSRLTAKDGINDYVVNDIENAVNAEDEGTKAAFHVQLAIPAGASESVCLRLTPKKSTKPFTGFEATFKKRLDEADSFFAQLQDGIKSGDARHVQRQALAGMMWCKQFYYFNITEWLDGDPAQPKPPAKRLNGRNSDWRHLNNADIISMPDSWEYPWYAAWDLAFHCIPIALIDSQFAKDQLMLLTREWYMHPNGQLPAYEWAFGDVNPPVHAWATWRIYKIDQKQSGKGDIEFLERVFHKLLLNFTWWVNRKDKGGNNIFQGGFLGLDNIGVFDRSAELPTGGHLEQADGTSWMAMYSLNMMRISIELALKDSIYEDLACKFFEHFLNIALAMTNFRGDGLQLWDDTDGFYYDQLHLPDGKLIPLKVRSLVGLIPLFAVEVIEPSTLEKLPNFRERLEWLLENRPELAELVSRWEEPGVGERRLLSLLRGHRMKLLLRRMLDESEFLSDYGIRGLSKVHKDVPYKLDIQGKTFSVAYTPAESDTRLFGGNSNWRGPIWFPVNYLLIESLQRFHHYYGDDFLVEYPSYSGKYHTIKEIADKLSERLTRIFLCDEDGKRAVYTNSRKEQEDPHFRDYLLFYEYFHGDNGRGVGAAHQTGWTGLIAKLLQPRR